MRDNFHHLGLAFSSPDAFRDMEDGEERVLAEEAIVGECAYVNYGIGGKGYYAGPEYLFFDLCKYLEYILLQVFYGVVPSRWQGCRE